MKSDEKVAIIHRYFPLRRSHIVALIVSVEKKGSPFLSLLLRTQLKNMRRRAKEKAERATSPGAIRADANMTVHVLARTRA